MTRSPMLAALLLATSLLLLPTALAEEKPSLTLDRWTYIQVDAARGKWGDIAEPKDPKYVDRCARDVTAHE